MKLLTKPIEKKLIKNFETNKVSETTDFEPIVKFFGGGACTWLITEYDPEERTYFGLCDLGQGYPELGWVSRDELESIKFPFGLGVERDRYWKAEKTINQYAKAARDKGKIVA